MNHQAAHTILEVDLASGACRIRPLDEKILNDYIGGLGLGVRILYDEVGPGVDPLSPENIIIIAPGPLSGTDAPASGRTQIVTKSPLTGILGIGNFGGSWGKKLRRAGYEALLIRNNSERPVYLLINNEAVQLLSAGHLWGKDSWQTTDLLKAEHGEDASVLAIGQAGENLVRFACPIADRDHAPGRSHAGCVMGAKKLKAIVVKGSREVSVARPDRFKAAVKEAVQRIVNYPEGSIEERRRISSSAKTTPVAKAGALPVMNFQKTEVPSTSDLWRADEVTRKYSTQECTDFSDQCLLGKYYGCNLRTEVKQGPYTGLDVGGAGFSLTWRYFMGACGIENFFEMMKCRELSQRYGMDMVSPVAFAIELFQRGILTRSDLGGMELNWGDGIAVMHLLGKIAFREGIGDILAEGSARAAGIIGKGAEKYAMTQKGMECMYIDPRISGWGMILGNTVGLRGGDDLTSTHVLPESYPGWARQLGWDEDTFVAWYIDYFDMFPEVKTRIFGTGDKRAFFKKDTMAGKAEWVIWLEKLHALFNSLGLCLQAGSCWLPMGPTHYAGLYSAYTGREITPREIMRTGDRIFNLMKCYLVREGLSAKDDDWPERFYQEPVPDGPFKGSVLDRSRLKNILKEYYELRGWDGESSIPGRATLRELGLGDAAAELEKLGRYPDKETHK
ncbi:MAG: aldehyde ferredoxin oxidoreductase family protein [Thermodesulfobacteriota bacterium]